MARKQVNECSSHRVTLCPEQKKVVLHKLADISPYRCNASINDAINAIIEEYADIKKIPLQV
jgi:hypothetical protein